MPSLKDVKMKIVGVGKTKQITKAMNMVASAKLRGAQARIERFRPYAAKYRQVIRELASKAEGMSHSLLAAHENKKYCANIINRAMKLAEEKKAEGMDVSFICVGRKGRDAAKKSGFKLDLGYGDRMGSLDFALASTVGKEAIHRYVNGDYDEVWLVYGEFVSMAQQPPACLQLMPLKAPKSEEPAREGPGSEYIYEPDEAKLLSDLLPRYINVQVYRALLDTSASEHAARMAAMDNATRNCNDMIQTLTLLYNKTRQASITSELIDIVGGAEALNG